MCTTMPGWSLDGGCISCAWPEMRRKKPWCIFSKFLIFSLQHSATTCDFQQCDILTWIAQTSLCSFLLSLETPNDVRPVVKYSLNIQTTSKDYNQTARMCRLVWAFAGRSYHLVGNLMSRLICMLGNSACFFVICIFFKVNIFKKYVQE